ncbi:protocadherin beta-12-like [Tigriopus californicus]|nr:protocadherin beta-12-like [Tigriopus californicus]
MTILRKCCHTLPSAIDRLKRSSFRGRGLVPHGIVVFLMALSQMISIVGGEQDARCFLDGGGATESFFIKESLSVGSLLGTLRVIGEIDKDIKLTLEDDEDVPIAVEESTKNVILTKALDKEGVSGPSSVIVDVICQRLNTEDPDFTIPINIRVTDVNDNAPTFKGGPYSLNISELTLVGSAIFTQIMAEDQDQPGPFSTIEYSIVDGQFSDHLTFLNPLEGTLYLAKQLDYETTKSFEVRLVARDQGSPPQESESILRINVQDADDQNPSFFYESYHALLPETNTQGQKLMVQPQDLRAFDKDQGLGSPLYYSFNANSDEYKYFELNRNSGHIYIKSDIPDDEFLRPVTLIIKATQFDNLDRYAITTLTVSRGGIFDSALQFLQKSYDVRILENVPLNSVILTLLTNKPSDRRVHFDIELSDLPDKEFSVSQRGDIKVRKVLDFEQVENYSFIVHANDGRNNDSARVNVTVLNINDWDPRFKYPQYEFFVSREDAFPGFILGRLEAHDGDKGDKVTLELKGPHARLFRINSRAELAIQDMKYLNGTDAHLVVVAEDSGIPPRSSSVPVAVHFPSGIVSGLEGTKLNQVQVMMGLALGLVLLFIIIISLMVYICKHKRKYSRTSPPGSRDNIMVQKTHMNPLQNGHNHPPLLLRRPEPNPKLIFNDRPHSNISDRASSEGNLATIQLKSNGYEETNRHINRTHERSADGGGSVILNPLNPRSASQRYGKNRIIRISHSPMPLYSTLGQANHASSTPPPPTPSIHSNGLPSRNLSSPSSSTRSSNVNTRISSHPDGAEPKHHGSSASVISGSSVSTQISKDWFDTYASNKRSLTETLKHSSYRDLSRIEWPRNSIPRRVKKLSWDDEMYRDRDISTLTDPNCSVTPLEQQSSENIHLGRAIYF